MNRIVLVTGGGAGLGKAVAARFRADGDTVIITGRERSQARERRGGDRRAADHLRRDGSRAGGGDGRRAGPGLDVLVNMAGGNTDFARPAAEQDAGARPRARGRS